MARRRKLTRKQAAAVKRHLKRTGQTIAIGSCRAIGGKVREGNTYISAATVICRPGPNRWELL